MHQKFVQYVRVFAGNAEVMGSDHNKIINGNFDYPNVDEVDDRFSFLENIVLPILIQDP